MPKWTPDDHGCIYDEAGCFARLTPNKAERLASRHNADIDALTAERDRLAAENAELRSNSQMLPSLHREVSELEDKLSAANATLDRLRDAWPDLAHSEPYQIINQYLAAHAILYPENET